MGNHNKKHAHIDHSPTTPAPHAPQPPQVPPPTQVLNVSSIIDYSFSKIIIEFNRNIKNCADNILEIENVTHVKEFVFTGTTFLKLSYEMGSMEHLSIPCSVTFDLTLGTSQHFDAKITAFDLHVSNTFCVFPQYSVNSCSFTFSQFLNSFHDHTLSIALLVEFFKDSLLYDIHIPNYTSLYTPSISLPSAQLKYGTDNDPLQLQILGTFSTNNEVPFSQSLIHISDCLHFSPSSFSYTLGEKIEIQGKATFNETIELNSATFSRGFSGLRLVKTNSFLSFPTLAHAIQFIKKSCKVEVARWWY